MEFNGESPIAWSNEGEDGTQFMHLNIYEMWKNHYVHYISQSRYVYVQKNCW